ncbi:hypothetical protein J437_LFUL019284 [Ladona fulva]|uniref:GH18 domain-containing protein n=1 Tax=Ladona fulva TaxID=123851 RepID=A0A8K0KRA9_LADFU|nr:hypothetical protein J437_LFUL019284 [Ladona fulva]
MRISPFLLGLYSKYPTAITSLIYISNTFFLQYLIIDLFIKKGLPPSKILITIPAMGNLFLVQRVLQNEQDANGSFTFLGSYLIHMNEVPGNVFHRDIMRIIRNSSLEWIIRRNEETKEPYAFTRTTLCASYEDTTSMEFKAKYVLEKGLGGIGIYSIDMEDSEGTTGEGRFPLTRADYNALSRGLQTVDIATEQT